MCGRVLCIQPCVDEYHTVWWPCVAVCGRVWLVRVRYMPERVCGPNPWPCVAVQYAVCGLWDYVAFYVCVAMQNCVWPCVAVCLCENRMRACVAVCVDLGQCVGAAASASCVPFDVWTYVWFLCVETEFLTACVQTGGQCVRNTPVWPVAV